MRVVPLFLIAFVIAMPFVTAASEPVQNTIDTFYKAASEQEQPQKTGLPVIFWMGLGFVFLMLIFYFMMGSWKNKDKVYSTKKK